MVNYPLVNYPGGNYPGVNYPPTHSLGKPHSIHSKLKQLTTMSFFDIQCLYNQCLSKELKCKIAHTVSVRINEIICTRVSNFR